MSYCIPVEPARLPDRAACGLVGLLPYGQARGLYFGALDNAAGFRRGLSAAKRRMGRGALWEQDDAAREAARLRRGMLQSLKAARIRRADMAHAAG